MIRENEYMRKKLKLGIGVAVICLLIFIIAMSVIIGHQKEPDVFSDEYVMAEELPALMSFTYYNQDEWETIVSEFAKGKLSYKELEELLIYIGVRDYVSYEEMAGFKKISRADFFQIYGQVLDILDVENRVSVENRIFIKEEADSDTWLTQEGYEIVSGGSEYIHTYDMYRVYTLEGDIIGLESQLEKDTPVLWKNIFIHKTDSETAQIIYEKELIQLAMPRLAEAISDTVCDIEWKGNAVSAIYKKEDMIRGTVLSYNEEQIEIEGYGALSHEGNLKIYKTYGTVEQLNESKLIIGNLVADFVVAEGKVCGIILKEPAQVDLIRVLLLNGESPYYQDVYVSANENADVCMGENKMSLDAGEILQASDFWKENHQDYLKIEPTKENANLFLMNESGETVSLGYQGSFEIRRYEEGYCVVNELTLEDYLCAVVPSEMPASYEIEALRAQAICARSYACIQLAGNKYANFAANVDDSTNYQVYNKQPRDERTTLAVQDTVGEVILYQGEIAEAYYYSTSCGFSQNMDVWNQESEGDNEYLQSVSLLTDHVSVDISDEETFAAFIQNKETMAYDSDGAYYRWSAELDLEGCLEQVNASIVARKNANPDNIQILDDKGNETDKNPDELGQIQQLLAEERSVGGVLKTLRIQYENGSVLLKTEYNIRKVLGEAVSIMTDKNDNAITIMSLLPSAAFTMIPVEEGYVLYGGGYGHGIGLSQNGANGMAKAGYTYMDILQKFYHNITIENIYNGSDGI